MSSCISGGGRAYGLNLDLIKSPTTTFSTSNSPSSSLSESTNSPLSIFSRKPRTPRKRPNQTYNEAEALLSTAYPKLFPAKKLPKPFKLTKSHDDNRGPFLSDLPDLLIPQKPPLLNFPKLEKPCQSPGEVTSTSRGNLSEICDEEEEFERDFDAESILDEEIEEGIDSIMGNLRVEEGQTLVNSNGYCYGFPVGMGFDFGFGMRAMRNADGGDRWSSPTVNVADVTHRIAGIPMVKKKKTKKKKKLEDLSPTSTTTTTTATTAAASSEDSIPEGGRGLGLKLNYDDVLKAWSDKASPFPGDSPGADVQERLAHIELFPENGAVRGAIVLRYKEKRRTRLFSKKIRYQVRKANADQRPRIKGRFVRTPTSGEDD